MSRKSRRHGRHLPRSKRKKGRKGFSPPAQPLAASQTYEPEPRTEAVAPPAKAPAPRPTAPLIQTPYVSAELKMIGILSGIILAILIALAFILP
jgi:hypothetical protein